MKQEYCYYVVEIMLWRVTIMRHVLVKREEKHVTILDTTGKPVRRSIKSAKGQFFFTLPEAQQHARTFLKAIEDKVAHINRQVERSRKEIAEGVVHRVAVPREEMAAGRAVVVQPNAWDSEEVYPAKSEAERAMDVALKTKAGKGHIKAKGSPELEYALTKLLDGAKPKLAMPTLPTVKRR